MIWPGGHDGGAASAKLSIPPPVSVTSRLLPEDEAAFRDKLRVIAKQKPEASMSKKPKGE